MAKHNAEKNTAAPKPAAAKPAELARVFKDARTGEIVTAEYAGQNPGSTFEVTDDLPA